MPVTTKKEFPDEVVGWKPGKEPQYIKKDDGKVFVLNSGREYPIAQEADFLRFRSFADDASDHWTLHHTKNDVFVWDKPSDHECGINIVKLFAEFPGIAPSTMYDCLHDAEYRPVWDSSMGEGYNICHLDANNDVGYYLLKLPAMVANRDFCNERSWRNVDGKEYIIMNHSEPHEMCPPTKAVRGESIISGYLIRPHGESGCSITYVSQSNPKGWIPVKLLNAVITSTGPSLIMKLRGAAAGYLDWKAKNHPDNHPWRTDPQPWSAPQPQDTVIWFAEKTGTTAEKILGFTPLAAGNMGSFDEQPLPPETEDDAPAGEQLASTEG